MIQTQNSRNYDENNSLRLENDEKTPGPENGGGVNDSLTFCVSKFKTYFTPVFLRLSPRFSKTFRGLKIVDQNP